MNWVIGIITAVIIGAMIYLYRAESSRMKRELAEFYRKEVIWAEKHNALCISMHKQLLPLKADMDRLKADVAGRHAVVKISDWPEQHAFGIEKCAGFILDWK